VPVAAVVASQTSVRHHSIGPHTVLEVAGSVVAGVVVGSKVAVKIVYQMRMAAAAAAAAAG